MYCYSNNGMSMRRVCADYQAQDGETLSENILSETEKSNTIEGFEKAFGQHSLLQQIYTLETSVTPRRMREAALGIDNGWLLALNNAIAALRAQIAV